MICVTPSLSLIPHKTPTFFFSSTSIRQNPSCRFTIRSSSSSLQEVEKDRNLGPELHAPPLFPAIKAAKRVVLVRHGQSTWNEEGRIQGSSNFSVLTKKGEAQAETSRQMLIDDAFDVCFTRSLFIHLFF